MKKVSIIVAIYNQADFLKDSVNSALAQTYKNTEIIIVNDGSLDNTKEVAQDLNENNKNIRVYNLDKNRGVVFARNFGIKYAEGEYILPLDGDDIIEPTYVEKAVQILDNNPDVGIVYSRARLFGAKNEYWDLPEPTLDNFVYTNCIFACALFKKSDFIRAGKYKEDFKTGYEDWDLWLSFLELGLKPYRIDEILFNYRQHNKESRNYGAILNNDEMRKLILAKHIGLFIKSENFLERIFSYKYRSAPKKIKKYKNLTKILIASTIIEFWVIIYFLII